MKMGLKYNFSRGGLSSPRSVPLTCHFECDPPKTHVVLHLMTWCTGKSDGSRGSTSKWRSFTNRTKPGLGKQISMEVQLVQPKTIYEDNYEHNLSNWNILQIWWKTFAGNFLGFPIVFSFPFWETFQAFYWIPWCWRKSGAWPPGISVEEKSQGSSDLAALPSNGWSVLGPRDHLALGASAKQIDVIGYLRKKMMRSNNCIRIRTCVFTTRYVCVLWSSYVFRLIYIYLCKCI